MQANGISNSASPFLSLTRRVKHANREAKTS
jgi:hypothetical protein